EIITHKGYLIPPDAPPHQHLSHRGNLARFFVLNHLIDLEFGGAQGRGIRVTTTYQGHDHSETPSQTNPESVLNVESLELHPLSGHQSEVHRIVGEHPVHIESEQPDSTCGRRVNHGARSPTPRLRVLASRGRSGGRAATEWRGHSQHAPDQDGSQGRTRRHLPQRLQVKARGPTLDRHRWRLWLPGPRAARHESRRTERWLP